MTDVFLDDLKPVKGVITPLIGGVFHRELIKAIDESKLWVRVVQYQWKWNIHQRHSLVQRLGAAILRAQKRGVAVSVILNQEAPNHHLTRINRVAGDNLARAGCQVKFYPPSVLVHTKLWIIDGRVVFLGSHNISTRSLSVNEETSVKIKSIPIARAFKSYFDTLWGG
jgi:phosphatidylserine/phosphatidylglycerophosphate/cardiolipin synthase-like enzyme